MDFGSTRTKAALVDVGAGALVAAADHPTTLDSDVLEGWEACREDLVATVPAAAEAPVLASSSAGGGLRIAVVGNEETVTAEAGRRVALSSGGRVVHVCAVAEAEGAASLVTGLGSARPDVVLLVGGTDGGNAEAVVSAASSLAEARWSGPVVVAGNLEAADRVGATLARGGTPFVVADNVVPRIGELRPESARAAVREMFVSHVIGGKELSRRTDFTSMVRGATPDVVLTAVELLARGLDEDRPGVGEVVVVDVGGATTDVHSVVRVDPDEAGLARQVVAPAPVARTVEGDLGVRWSAESTAAAGVAAGLVAEGDTGEALAAQAALRRAEPAGLPHDRAGARVDEQLAMVAATLALRRHAGRRRVLFGADGRVVQRTGRDLREVGLVVGSGGVLRHASPARAAAIMGTAVRSDGPEGWQLPVASRTVVDRSYVLAAAGLLAGDHPEAAYRLLHRLR